MFCLCLIVFSFKANSIKDAINTKINYDYTHNDGDFPPPHPDAAGDGTVPDTMNNVSVKEITGMIIIYVLIKHIHNGHNKIKGSTDKVFNYFIKHKDLAVIDEKWKTFKYDKSFYGLIPNNYRKVPIPYFKYNPENTSIKTDLKNDILIKVNDKITKLNQIHSFL